MKMRTIVLILVLTAAAVAQSPVLSTGRDYTNNVNRAMSVDSAGRLNVNSSGGGGSGCPGTTGTPCVVAGTDGTTTRILKTDAAGQTLPGNASAAGADGVSNTVATPTGAAAATLYYRSQCYLFNNTTWDRCRGNVQGQFVVGPTVSGSVVDAAANPVLVGVASGGGRARYLFSPSAVPDGDAGNSSMSVAPSFFNGSTWDRGFKCPLTAPITLSAGTDVRIATGTSATKVRICNVSFSGDNPAVVTIRQGTQTTTPCDTSTAALSGGYQNTLGLALDFGPQAALTTTATNTDVCLHFSTAVTAGGMVSYAQF